MEYGRFCLTDSCLDLGMTDPHQCNCRLDLILHPLWMPHLRLYLFVYFLLDSLHAEIFRNLKDIVGLSSIVGLSPFKFQECFTMDSVYQHESPC